MTKHSPNILKKRTSLIYLAASILVLVFWTIGQIIDIYDAPFVGAVFELLWLPAIAAIFILPIATLIQWRKEKFSFTSLNLFSLFINALTIFLLFKS